MREAPWRMPLPREQEGVAICYDTNLRLKLWTLAEVRAVILDTVPHVQFSVRPEY